MTVPVHPFRDDALSQPLCMCQNAKLVELHDWERLNQLTTTAVLPGQLGTARTTVANN